MCATKFIINNYSMDYKNRLFPTYCLCLQTPKSLNRSTYRSCASLEDLILQYPNDAIWLAGNFNLPDIDWNNYSITGNNYPLPMNESFLDFSNKFGLLQIVTLPTRGNNIIDIFLTNYPSAITHYDISPGINDRYLSHQPCRRKIYLWNKADNMEIQSFFACFNNYF